MRTIILDMRNADTREKIHDCLAREFDFPDSYGNNLDALYDLLTDISEETCVGYFAPAEPSEMKEYIDRVCQVMTDADERNEHLAVVNLKYEF